MKYVLIAAVLVFSAIGIVYLFNRTPNTQLSESVEINQRKEDFILHIRVEEVEGGFQVLRSLQYTGTEKITIEHRTPLIAVAINKQANNFTGSPVVSDMDSGNIYHPQSPRIFPLLEKGTHKLYIHAEFLVDEELVNMTIEKEISFE